MVKDFWIDVRNIDSLEKRKDVLTEALELGIVTAIVNEDDTFNIGKIDFITPSDLNGGDYRYCEINTPEDQDQLLNAINDNDTVIVKTKNWTIIPLENIIAKSSGRNVKIYAYASTMKDAKLYFETMERGVDGVIIESDDYETIRSITQLNEYVDHYELDECTVTDVVYIGMGDRVCIDTTTMMKPGQGMLIGSQSSCMFLVQSESEEVGYVAPRPFRVNAGAVHSYLACSNDSTKYLSEVKAGSLVSMIDSSGNVSEVHVGRSKVERRPLLMITASIGSGTANVILQNAETVKVMGPSGSISVSNLKKGDVLYCKTSTGGRHFGMAIEESVSEL